MNAWGKIGLFVGGLVFGTAGVAVLSSEDAKKAYTHCTAAVMRGRDCVVKRAEIIRENCEDISAAAKDINEERLLKAREREIADARAVLEAAEAEAAAMAETAEAGSEEEEGK